MAHTPPYSGKYGMVNGQTAVRNWNLTRTTSPPKGVHSGTKGGPSRKPGVKDWSGNFGCYGAVPVVMPGGLFTFIGFTAPDSGPPTGDGVAWTGPAIVDSMQLDWNWETGDILAHQINFSSNGAMTKSSASNYVDSTVTELQETTGLNAINATSNSPITICNITTASLQITADNQSFVNSCTAGQTQRRPGNIDATLSLTIQDTDPTQMGCDLSDDVIFQMNVTISDSPDYYLLQWMHFANFSNLVVDRESGAIISFQANFEMNLIVDGAMGAIVLPGAGSAYLGTAP